jgi:hypothetical protein
LRHRRNRRRALSIFDVLADEFAPPPLDPRLRSYGDAVHCNVTAPRQLQGIEGTTRWGLGNNIDARLPFVDAQLVRFLESVSDEHAYHGNALKPLLRDAMRAVVPATVIARRDKGDYTAAVARGAVPAEIQIDHLNGLRDLYEFGLMSRPSIDRTLARLRAAPEVAAQTRELTQLTGVCAWLRIFFRRG